MTGRPRATLPEHMACCPGHGVYQAGCGGCQAYAARYKRRLRRDVAYGRPRIVDATGTRRRLQGLAAAGWRARDVAAHLGCSGAAVTQWSRDTGPTTVAAATAEKVRVAARTLITRAGPSPITARRATRAGWVTLGRWGDDIDDPHARPEPLRAPGRAATAEDAAFLASQGAVWASVATRLGVSVEAVRTALTRAGMGDVVAVLDRATYGPASPLTRREAQPRPRDQRKDAA